MSVTGSGPCLDRGETERVRRTSAKPELRHIISICMWDILGVGCTESKTGRKGKSLFFELVIDMSCQGTDNAESSDRQVNAIRGLASLFDKIAFVQK